MVFVAAVPGNIMIYSSHALTIFFMIVVSVCGFFFFVSLGCVGMLFNKVYLILCKNDKNEMQKKRKCCENN